MGNENSRLYSCPQKRQVRLPVSEINPQEIVTAQRTVLNILTETDKVCIGEVEVNIIKEPQFVWKNCELRIFLDEITLILQAGKCKNVVECFIEDFIQKNW